ncbi:hypothetical protein BRC81_10450 [Halobacteriales archaeon QS_1_68_20]|nr:MAG: hypothetical protein BRC81_10450 [Halobacteriales archaeon QS_1_68_20]
MKEYLGPGDGLGFLPEIVLAVSLLLGAATIAVGGYALLNDRPQLSLTGVVGFATLKLTFVTKFYSTYGRNRPLVIPLAMTIILAAMAATWSLSGRLSPHGNA